MVENLSVRVCVCFCFHCLENNLHSSLASTLGSVDSLDIFTLGKGTLVGSETTLGKFVDTLVGGRTSSLDHIENSALIRGKSNNLTGNFPSEKGALGSNLWKGRQRICISVRMKVTINASIRCTKKGLRQQQHGNNNMGDRYWVSADKQRHYKKKDELLRSLALFNTPHHRFV
jgi:hypothetical protein